MLAEQAAEFVCFVITCPRSLGLSSRSSLGVFVAPAIAVVLATRVAEAVASSSAGKGPTAWSDRQQEESPPVGLEPTIFGLEVRRLVH